MDIETQTEILKYLRENGPISSRGISEFLGVPKKDIYAFLTECEEQDIAIRKGGKDGNTIVFHWSLNPNIGELHVE